MLHLIDIPSIENFPFIEQTFDSPTLYGLVVKIGKNLNEAIIKVNELAKTVEDIDINFDAVNKRIDDLNLEFQNLLSDFEQFKTDINNTIDSRFNQIYNQLISLMNDYQASFTYALQTAVNELNDRIDRIELGDISAYNPTTGRVENINKVLTDIYDSVRYDALTCTEFESLDYTASGFDAVEITAFNFDNNGKSILSNT